MNRCRAFLFCGSLINKLVKSYKSKNRLVHVFTGWGKLEHL